mmetsp:Transcript_4948/g.18401  ORF Transcript_4948/g.18401 Transcript_4948/m.18401 type:complete len:349 (+) Transcript_4948:118-1164(+)
MPCTTTSPTMTSVASSLSLVTWICSSCFFTWFVSNNSETLLAISSALVEASALGITSVTSNACLFASSLKSSGFPESSSHDPTVIDFNTESKPSSSKEAGSTTGFEYRSVTFSSGERSSTPNRARASFARAFLMNSLTPFWNTSSDTSGHLEPATLTLNETRKSKCFRDKSSNAPVYAWSAILVRMISPITSSETPFAMSPRNTSSSNNDGACLRVTEPVACVASCLTCSTSFSFGSETVSEAFLETFSSALCACSSCSSCACSSCSSCERCESWCDSFSFLPVLGSALLIFGVPFMVSSIAALAASNSRCFATCLAEMSARFAFASVSASCVSCTNVSFPSLSNVVQ